MSETNETLCEPGSNSVRSQSAVTILEERDENTGSSSQTTIIESRDDTTQFATPGLKPGTDFLEYHLLHPLKVVSAEADLWLVERKSDCVRFVLKLYRYGIEPKKEVQEMATSWEEKGRLLPKSLLAFKRFPENMSCWSLKTAIGRLFPSPIRTKRGWTGRTFPKAFHKP